MVPRIFWRYLVRHGHSLAERFPTYEECEAFFTNPRASLEEYLELHTVVEQVQREETLAYFVSKLVRGAYVFEGICYLELRYTPYYRTDSERPADQRVTQMREVVRLIGEAGRQPDYPLLMRQILCMHSQHLVHVPKVDRHAAQRCVDMTLKRSAGAERNDRDAVAGANAYDLLHVCRGLREHHRIGRLIGHPGERIAVLFAHRLRGHQAVAEGSGQRSNDSLDRCRIAELF